MNSPYLHSPTSTHWWTRSKSSSKLTKEKLPETPTLSRTHSTSQADAVPDTPTKQSSMFGNFTSVIRFKPKKNVHTFAIQEPQKVPSPLIIPPPNSSEPYGPLTSRPYSKAVSAVTIDSIESKAPLDLNLTHQKPLVDFDPFAATSGVTFSSKEPQQLERLFVPPDSHVTDAVPASSVSSQTTHRRHGAPNPHVSRERLVSEMTAPTRGPAATVRTQQSAFTTRSNPRTRKVSMNDVPISSPVISSPVSTTKSITHGQSKSRSSGGPRPHTRPRGMTDNTGIRPSIQKEPDQPSLTRKPSFSRSIPPETSPPSQDLPPVPSFHSLSSLPNSDGSPSDPGSSSSSLSFASSFESDPLSENTCVEGRRLRSIRDRAKIPSEPTTKSPTRVLGGAPNPTLSKKPATSDGRVKPVKKMPSQPSLQKPPGSLSTCAGDQSLDSDSAFGPNKLLKKQRSFHHHRVPVPPLPYMKQAAPPTPSEASVSQSAESPKHKERERQKEKRESAASLSKRRFLPGSIRRGSSSHMAAFTFDDDTGSIIIPPSELALTAL